MSKKPPHKQKLKKIKSNLPPFFNPNPNNLVASLDLHRGPRSLEEVSYLVDQFLVSQRRLHFRQIQQGGRIRLGLIVGAGHNSQRSIGGKNPLRHFVESYLAQTDIVWQADLTNPFNSGLIIVELE